MEWIKTSQAFPNREGIYLCDIEGNYGLFEFFEGKFHPNDWNEYRGMNEKYSYVGSEDCILAWCVLPEFPLYTLEDVKFFKDRTKARRRKERKENL
jgi:hypothetical protein